MSFYNVSTHCALHTCKNNSRDYNGFTLTRISCCACARSIATSVDVDAFSVGSGSSAKSVATILDNELLDFLKQKISTKDLYNKYIERNGYIEVRKFGKILKNLYNVNRKRRRVGGNLEYYYVVCG